jgi:hypothetical protein
VKTQTSRSAEIRARLDHPVIDADGHMIEFEAGVLDYLERAGGRRLVELLIPGGGQICSIGLV